MRELKGKSRRDLHRLGPSRHRLRLSRHHRPRNRQAVRVTNHLVLARQNLLVPPVPSRQVQASQNQLRLAEIKLVI